MVRQRLNIGPIRREISIGPDIRIPRPLVNTDIYIVLDLSDNVELIQGTLIAMEQQLEHEFQKNINLWHPVEGKIIIDTAQRHMTEIQIQHVVTRIEDMLNSAFVNLDVNVSDWMFTTGHNVDSII